MIKSMLCRISVLINTSICVGLTMAEVLQGFEDVYDRHFFEVYFVHSFNSIFYVVWKFWL